MSQHEPVVRKIPIERVGPKPLPNDYSGVEAFDYELLPTAFQAWVQDISERMQCPPDYPAVAAMVALASLVGRQVTIRPKKHDDWYVVPNLFGAVVGPPGALKTPALKEPLIPIYRLQSEAMEKYEAAQITYAADELVYQEQVKIDRVKVKELLDSKKPNNAQNSAIDLIETKPEPPICSRYMVNDTTVERLQEILSENPNGVLQFRDELTGLLRQMDKPGHETDRAFILEAWNGNGSFTSDRIGRGMTHVEFACLSILGGIQPGPLKAYFAGVAHGAGGDDGLLQRFQMLVYPDIPMTWRNVDRAPDLVARSTAHAVFKDLKDLKEPQHIGAKTDADGELPFLRFSEQAQEVFDNWRHELESRLRKGDMPAAIESHLSKYRSLVPSLALLIHLANGEFDSVDIDCVRSAIAWAIYLESHARRVYAPVLNPDMESAKALADKIQAGRLGKEFTIKDVYASHWSNLTKSAQARAAVNILIDYDWLTTIDKGTAGATRTTYVVNPLVSEL